MRKEEAMKTERKRKWIGGLVILLFCAQASAGEAPALKTQKEIVSYGIGVDMSKNFKKQGIEVDLDLLVKGFKDDLSGKKLLVDEKDLRKSMRDYQAELRQRLMQAYRVAALENKKKGDAFLDENRKKEGVVALPSGLQYKVLKAGDGRKPTDADTVEVHYRGTLIDGTEFDGTDAGQPAAFKVKGGVIPGMTEALKLMATGSKWQLFIPPQLAYGERGTGRDIGPNETIVFEVELIAVK